MQITNKYNLPSSLSDALTNDTYDISKVGNILSVTTLINSPKISYLTRRHWDKLEQDISERIWLLLGSAVHSVLERIDETNRMIEKRMYADTSNWELINKENLKSNNLYIAGKPDLYETKEFSINDYKITSVWSIIYGKKEWEYQLNLYAWFYRKLGLKVEKLKIIAILRDWNKKECFNNPSYPKIPVAIVDVPLWTFEKQDKYLKERYELHSKYKDTKDDFIPECTPDERWKKTDTYAVYKNENKRAFKVFESGNDAEKFKDSMNIGKDKFTVVHRPSSDTRCLGYCSVNNFCHFYKKEYGVKNEWKKS